MRFINTSHGTQHLGGVGLSTEIHNIKIKKYVTFPYREDHLPQSSQPTGVQRRGRCRHRLRGSQLSSAQHHLETQGLQDPTSQRWWASEKVQKCLSYFLAFFTSSSYRLPPAPGAVASPPCQVMLLDLFAIPTSLPIFYEKKKTCGVSK